MSDIPQNKYPKSVNNIDCIGPCHYPGTIIRHPHMGIEFIKEITPNFNFTHILVDELQDTSKSQLEFIKQLHNKYNTRFLNF